MGMSSAAMKAFAIVLIVTCVFLCPARAADPRLVFAHYMLFANDNIDVLKQEIRIAQSKGIDAFALNSNVWRQNLVDNMYQAAREVGSSFKIFFSADIHKDANGNLTPDQLVTMLTRYETHPNQMKYRGKPLFTSWLGNDDSWWAEYGYSSALSGWNDVFQRAGGRGKFFFVPFFPTDGSYWGVRGTAEKFTDVVDGMFAWDTSAWPYISPDFQNPSGSKDQNYLTACNDIGKVYMASPSPWFFKNILGTCCSDACKAKDLNSCNCQVKGNYQGPGLWIKKWEQLIQLSPPLVEIVTWNDWVESSYVAPPLSTASADVAGFTHRAFLELGQYYISWYKSGSPPAITRDSLFMFYYTHSKNVILPADGCQVLYSDQLTDKLYVTSMLTGPATVELRSGSSSATFNAPAGVSTWALDFEDGQQVAVLRRGGSVISTLTGSKPIGSSVNYNFNVYSTCTTCI
ncbi:hypothetical protein SUGI_0695790 [Cryptomeria japonica]|uniref:glucan endo-1,3-alpha-glucosidase agn1 n=1 Tax=Cryptomeria japonica TaxID=3369 RepID=UPI00241499E1|nr:glucan endo-1,3-alpha-glucosidase agn1 [Cryptomeria japonica]GLJ34595.1 hypothetical protein SUGI_0695790 [Cryptomeria japonica]